MRSPLVFRAILGFGVLAIGCSSGGGGGSPGTGGGSGSGQGTAGSSAAGTGGTSSSGTAGTQGSAGTGGSPAGVAGNGAAGNGAAGNGTGGPSGGSSGTAGQTGSGGSGGTGGTVGAAGTGGTARGGNGGVSGTVGSGGVSGRGGAGGSAAGTGGSSPDGGVSSVTPTMSGSRYRFAWNDTVLEVDASVGARVATLTVGGTDVIMPSSMAAHVDGGTALDPTTWGSVFWTSPRSAWTPQTWPPPANIDNAAYTGTISGAHATFMGMADTSIGVAMAKDYSVDANTGWISITYTIKASKSLKAAPWEISRVPRGGITFFPVPMASSVTNQVPLTITQTGSSPTIVWFDDASMTAKSPNGDKLFADGAQGWTAYVHSGVLFLKKYTDIPASMQPTGEGEVDVYPGNGFLEFEVEGPYTQLSANGSLPWSIQWKVVKVPSSVTIAAGSSTLLDFAKQQLGL